MAELSCNNITVEKIRAEIWLGSVLLAKTPLIDNFTVNKSRSQLSNTFSATIKLLAGTTFSLGENISIKAGTKGNLKTIFTGIIKTTRVDPAFGLPGYWSVNLAGSGVLDQLQKKKFTRRLRFDGQGLFCTITGGPSNRPAQGKSLSIRTSSGNKQTRNNSPNPASQQGENSALVEYNSGNRTSAAGAAPVEIAGKPTSAGQSTQTGGDGFRVHTHEDLDEGGPAFAVYSSD